MNEWCQSICWCHIGFLLMALWMAHTTTIWENLAWPSPATAFCDVAGLTSDRLPPRYKCTVVQFRYCTPYFHRQPTCFNMLWTFFILRWCRLVPLVQEWEFLVSIFANKSFVGFLQACHSTACYSKCSETPLPTAAWVTIPIPSLYISKCTKRII